ncbi:MAG: hypothetical protein ACERKX_03060 [Anaerolineales bacterium]
MLPKKALIASLVILMLAVPLVAQADDDPVITVFVSCNQVDFSIDINGGTGTYNVEVIYGDGGSDSFEGVPPISPFTHTYALGDSYDWEVKVRTSGTILNIKKWALYKSALSLLFQAISPIRC